jgi:hypothetical protein
MKHFLYFHRFIVFIALICLGYHVADAQYTLQDQDVTLDSRQFITACSYNFATKAIIIPDTLQGVAIKGIGIGAFEGKGITSVVLPSGLEKIEGTAFRSNALTTVSFPAGLRYLGRHSFRDNFLTNVVMPNSVEFVGNETFKNNNISSATLSTSLAYLGYQAFVQNVLSSITLPASLNYIGVQAFISNSITSFVLPNNFRPGFQHWRNSNGDTLNPLTTVTALNLSYTASIPYTLHDTDVTMENGYITGCRFGIGTILTIPSQLQGQAVVGIADMDEQEAGVFSFMGILDISLPTGFRYLGKFSFSDNSFYFANLTFPNSLEHIGYFSFYWSNIRSVTIPNSVKFIDDQSFAWNPNLITLQLGNSVEYIGAYAFVRGGITSLTIPNSVTHIGQYAFEYNAISTLTLGNSVKYIQQAAFNVNNIAAVTIPGSVISIGKYAFKSNTLTSFTLPAATKNGHTFQHWVDENNVTHNGNTSVNNFDIYYVAQFTINNGTAIFNVSDIHGELPHAEVVLNGSSYYTGYDGQAIVAGLANGTYPYQVKMQGYYDSTGSVLISNGYDIKNVMLAKLTWQHVGFYVKDPANNPIHPAMVVIDNTSLPTDANGYAELLLVSGYTYPYHANAPGYFADSGNVVIGSSDTTIYLTLFADTTAVPEYPPDLTLNLYPNPVTDVLQINFTGGAGALKTIEVTGLSGQVLKRFSTSDQAISIDMTDLHPGIYFLMICDGKSGMQGYTVLKK